MGTTWTNWYGPAGTVYKWRAKMIFVRPTRNKWAGGVVPLCDILVHRVSRSPKKRRRSACVTPTGGACTWRTALRRARGWTVFLRHVLVGRVRRDGQGSHTPFRQHTQPSNLLPVPPESSRRLRSLRPHRKQRRGGGSDEFKLPDGYRSRLCAEILVRSLSREGEIMLSRDPLGDPRRNAAL